MKRVVRRLTYINAPAIDDDQIRKFHHTDANSVLEALPGSKFLRPPSVPKSLADRVAMLSDVTSRHVQG
jgi:hypothetical protein